MLTTTNRFPRDIVYWYSSEVPDHVIFARRDEAEYEVQRLIARYVSQTWGEFKSRLPIGERVRIYETHDMNHLDTDPFDPSEVDTGEEGDYPDWLRVSQLLWMPEHIVEKCGTVMRSGPSDYCVVDFRIDYLEYIIDYLLDRGYSLEWVDMWNLLAKAIGQRNRLEIPGVIDFRESSQSSEAGSEDRQDGQSK